MTDPLMTADQVAELFTRADGSYVFARWARPITPIVFGVDDASLSVIKGAIEAVVTLADHKMAETDPELGANFMLFFLRDWDEVLGVPDLDRLVPDLAALVAKLKEADANQYRIFRFEEDGAIKACFSFVRMDAQMEQIAAEDLALNQAVQAIVLWSDLAFTTTSPMARLQDRTILRPEIAAVVRACYDRILPAAAMDASHALRVSARMGRTGH
jgi:hypothetical protein